MVGRVDRHFGHISQDFAGQRVDLDYALDFVAKELDAYGGFFVGGHQFQSVAADAELGPGQVHVVALVLHVHQLAHQLAAVAGLSDFDAGHQVEVVVGVTQTVDAGHRGHYQYITPCQ